MIEEYDPREGRLLSLLNEEGELPRLPAGMPRLHRELARRK